MFKKLILVLVLSLVVMIGSVWGVEKGQECTMNTKAKIFLFGPRGNAIPVQSGRDLQIIIGEKINAEGAAKLNKKVMEIGETDMDWVDANLAVVAVNGDLIIVRDLDIRDCK